MAKKTKAELINEIDLLDENRELEYQMRSYEEEIEQNKREIEELRDCICNKQKSD